MRSVRIQFEWTGLSVDVYPATAENGAYSEALQRAAAPHQLALSLNKLTEETAERVLVEAYSRHVVAGSPDPELSSFGPEDWARWLSEHRDEFDFLREIAQNPQDWEKMANGGQ